MKFALFLALKYLRPKRSVASVITCVSVLGVMLGVAAVIIVRSVMTGFGDTWEEKILDFKPHISLVSWQGGAAVAGEDGIAKELRRLDGVISVTPEIDTRVMLAYRGRVLAPVILGIDADEFIMSPAVFFPADAGRAQGVRVRPGRRQSGARRPRRAAAGGGSGR